MPNRKDERVFRAKSKSLLEAVTFATKTLRDARVGAQEGAYGDASPLILKIIELADEAQRKKLRGIGEELCRAADNKGALVCSFAFRDQE